MPIDAPLYPVNLVLAGRPCLVVGGGRVAVRKIEGLLACRAAVTVVSPEVVPGIETLPVVRRARRYRPDDLVGQRLVVAATDDPLVNAAVVADADAAGVWVNRVDEADRGSFTLPSVVRRGPLLVAVSTGGHSPALAAWLKGRVASQLGPEWQVLLELVSVERQARRAGGLATADADWLKVLDSDILELIKSGQVERAREQLRSCLSSS